MARKQLLIFPMHLANNSYENDHHQTAHHFFFSGCHVLAFIHLHATDYLLSRASCNLTRNYQIRVAPFFFYPQAHSLAYYAGLSDFALHTFNFD